MMTEDQPKMFASSRPPEPVAEELERSYLAAVDHADSFLGVGCANGLLLESIIAWGETLTMVAWVDRE